MLSKSETCELLDNLRNSWPHDVIPKAKNIKVYEIEQDVRLLVADQTIAVQVQNKILPFLGGQLETLKHFPFVTVDMGAVKFVCNGAKIMRPGISSFGSFKKGDIVVVNDLTHGKALAIGIALEESESAKMMAKGYVIDNIHYISDKMWEAYKEIRRCG